MLPTAPASIGDPSIIEEHLKAFLVPCYNAQRIILIQHPIYQMFKKMKISRVVQIKKHPLFATIVIH